MADNRNPCCGNQRDSAYIDTYRIYDSCRDKDCFEDVAVFLTDYGRDVVEHAGNVRCCSAVITAADIRVDPIPFNNGFYRIDVRIYVKMTFECCIGMSNRQIIEGVAAVDKKLVLYGGEGNVSVFRSDPRRDSFCPGPGNVEDAVPECGCRGAGGLPLAVLEAADPVVLGAKLIERSRPHCCCTSEREIPESVCSSLGGRPVPQGERRLVVSLGFFTVTRLQRPEQYLLNATECSVPDKECSYTESEDPCTAFRNMEFPVSEFSGTPQRQRL